jgi:hypothetical protein
MLFDDFEINSTYETIRNNIEQQRSDKTGRRYFIDETLMVIKKNPFNEYTIELLLKEGWTYKADNSVWSTCNQDKKIINLDKKIISEGKVYDFYDRDIILMHELNHAWYERFNVMSQSCLIDIGTIHEDENRLINELISRKNRANPWILKKAVEGFGLEPQIYDLASKMAFEHNPKAKISNIANKNKDLLKIVLMDGHKSHYEFSKQF